MFDFDLINFPRADTVPKVEKTYPSQCEPLHTIFPNSTHKKSPIHSAMTTTHISVMMRAHAHTLDTRSTNDATSSLCRARLHCVYACVCACVHARARNARDPIEKLHSLQPFSALLGSARASSQASEPKACVFARACISPAMRIAIAIVVVIVPPPPADVAAKRNPRMRIGRTLASIARQTLTSSSNAFRELAITRTARGERD